MIMREDMSACVNECGAAAAAGFMKESLWKRLSVRIRNEIFVILQEDDHSQFWLTQLMCDRRF